MQHTSPGLLAALEFRWLDVLGLAIVVYFLVIGTRRGMWWQIVRLLGVIASIAVARAAAPRLAPHLAQVFPDMSLRVAGGSVWTIVILLGLLVVAIVGRFGKESLEALEIGNIDRIGGALAGALTGVLVHASIVLCMCQLADADWSVAQVRGTTSQRLVDSVGRKMPLFLDSHACETLEPWLRPPLAAR